MANQNGSYPHPVVGHGDDVQSTFQVDNARFAYSPDEVEVIYRLRCDDPDLVRLIQVGRVKHVARWSCAATLSSGDLRPVVHKHHADGATYRAWVDQRMVRDRVSIDVKAVAAQDFPGYRLTRQHPDYGEASFNLAVGDTVAVGGSFEVLVDKLFDPMQPPLGSCFRIVETADSSKAISLHFGEKEYVKIQISREMADGLRGMSDRPELQLTLVILPALMETITFIERNEAGGTSAEDLMGFTWAETITNLIEERGGNAEQSLEKAQRILGFPLKKVLTEPLVLEDEV